MKDEIFTHMQAAVDIVGTSEHPANKIAATLAGKDASGKDFALSRVNHWPAPIKDKIGTAPKIGNSSGTIHAEVDCITHAPMTNDASLFITDPPCPNCVKNMTEAGIKKLYIDHKGFDKDFAARRGGDFETMSMEICRKAGVSVYKMHRKEKRIEVLFETPKGYSPGIEKRARIEILKEPACEESFRALIKKETAHYKNRPFALVFAAGQLSHMSVISAEIHAVAGFTSKTAPESGKYNYLLQPVHRVLMTAARYGLKIDRNYIFSSRVPTARELVNMTGAGFSKMYIGNDEAARDEFGLQALKQLLDAGIMKVKHH
jgi:deoxycytidylate deaminase